MTIVRIEIAEIENRNVYRAWHDGEVLIERTTSPMRAAAQGRIQASLLSALSATLSLSSASLESDVFSTRGL